MRSSRGLLYFVIYHLSYHLRNLGAFGQPIHHYDDYNYLVPSPGLGYALIIVDIKEQFSTNEIKYRYDPETKFHEFIARKPYLIDKVTKKGRVIWDSAYFDYEYGYKVVLGECIGGNRLFRVYFPHEVVPSPSDSDASGKSLPKFTPQTPIFTTFDVQDKFTTDQVIYSYDENHHSHRFLAVEPYVFSQIHKNGLIVWEYEEGDYPNEALIFPDELGRPILRVFLSKPPEIVKHAKRPQLPKHLDRKGPVIKTHRPIHRRPDPDVVEIITPGVHRADPVPVPTTETEVEKEFVRIPKPGAPRVDPISVPTTETERGSPTDTEVEKEYVKIPKPGAPRVDPITVPTTESDRGSIRERVRKPEVVKIIKPGAPRVGPIPVPATESDRGTPPTDIETEVETQWQPDTDDQPESVSEFEVPAKTKHHEELESEPEIEVSTKTKQYEELETESEIDVPSKPKHYEELESEPEIEPPPKAKHKKLESESEIEVPSKPRRPKNLKSEPEVKVKVKPIPDFEIIDSRMAFQPKPNILDLRPVELNLDYKYSTFSYDYTQYNNVGTYIPKEGYAIIAVRWTDKFLIFGTDVVIWRSFNPELYATKVVFTGISKIANTVKLYLNNGEIKVFCKKTDRNIWKEEEDVVPDIPDPLDRDPRLLDIDIENFAKSIVYDIRYIDDHDIGKLNYVFYPKKKYLFKSVMQESYVIWKARDLSECASIVHVRRYTFPDLINLIIMTPDGNRRLFIKTIPRICKLPTWKEESLEPINKRLMKSIRRVVPI